MKPARNRHAAEYADALFPSFPRAEMHPWLFNNKQFLNNPTAIRRVAAETSGVDDGVGTVLETLERLGLDNDTMVVYTADQGWVGGQNGLWGMGDHTRPLAAFDGMMRVPLIVRQPGRVPAGKTSDRIVDTCDLDPTLLGALGLADRMPDDAAIAGPGRLGDPARGGARRLGRRRPFSRTRTPAIRTPEWKYVHRHPDGPHELYDLAADPHEKVNLYGQPLQARTQAELKDRLDAFFARYADPKYDLYRGGGSKTHLHIASPAGG